VGSVESKNAKVGRPVTDPKKIVLNPRGIKQLVMVNGTPVWTSDKMLLMAAQQDLNDKRKKTALIRQIKLRQADEDGECMLCPADFDEGAL
jgi:hypothetical protein